MRRFSKPTGIAAGNRMMCCLVLCCCGELAGNVPPAVAQSDKAGALTLADLAAGRVEYVDLTYTLNSKNPYWPGDKYQPFRLETIATLEQDGVLSKAFSLPEHLGTHLDAPNHFEPDQPAVHELKPDELFGPGVVIDIESKVEHDVDAELTVADLEAWERQHGEIPARAIVMLHTGWGRFWDNYSRYKNQDIRGKLHFPAYSADAARWLIEKRNVRGIGIDTLSIDRGISPDFMVHHIVNRAGRFGLENVANLNRLPPRGFYVSVAPIKIESGSGGPARITAILAPR